MNSKALVGNLILLFLVVLLIFFMIKGKRRESFLNSEGCPGPVSEELLFDEEGNLTNGPLEPPNYNPNDYHMCKNIGWINNDSPYKTVTNQAWYDAEVQCKNDFLCNSFTSYGDAGQTTSNVDYYTSTNVTELAPGTWSSTTYNKPNLYMKTTSPCTTNKTITYYNENSDGNLQSNENDIPYRYVNDFITDTRGFLNDNNAYRIAKDSGTISDYSQM